MPPIETERQLPPEIRELAARLGAHDSFPANRVLLTQSGSMRNGPDHKPMHFTASQSIDVTSPRFSWRARTGPLGLVTVIDDLGDTLRSEVRLLGALRLAGGGGGMPLRKAQLMRYLAELAWAPDAILRNASLDWDVSGESIGLSAPCGATRATVRLALDSGGRVASVSASRPRMEGRTLVDRPWMGRFFDYRLYRDRWLPFQGQAGWMLDDQLVTVWHGRIESWEML